MIVVLLALLAGNSDAVLLDKTVVYEENLRAEGPSGGFASCTRRLKSIKDLGVTTIWLMPVTPVGKVKSAGGLGSPYAVADYLKVNPDFGSSADLKNLINEAHRLKMKVILDWVANHTAWDNRWVKQHPEWYTKGLDGNIISKPDGTNWQDVADLNFDVKPMRAAMISAMQYWVHSYGIDGFRCDTADWVPTDFWKEAISALRAKSKHPLLMLAEGSKAEMYAAGFDLTYGWPVYHRLKEIYAGAKATQFAVGIAQESKDAPKGARWLRFTSNHDESAWQNTTEELFKTPAGVKAAFALTALSERGTPLIYTGQEVGWQKRIPIFDRSVVDWRQDSSSRQWIKNILHLRASSRAIQLGKNYDFSNDDVTAYVRFLGTEQICIVANVRNHPSTIALPKSVFSSSSSPIKLAPFECRIFRNGMQVLRNNL